MVWQKEKEHKKKDIRYLNACLDRDLHDELDAFCKKHGISKTRAVEVALRSYMNIGDGDDSTYWHNPAGSDIKREKKMFPSNTVVAYHDFSDFGLTY